LFFFFFWQPRLWGRTPPKTVGLLGDVTDDAPQVRQCMNSADVLLLNDSTVGSLAADIDYAQLTNQERLRPSWDTYFMTMADLAARRSNCMKRRVGCVLVVENRVVATGYNGTPRYLFITPHRVISSINAWVLSC